MIWKTTACRRLAATAAALSGLASLAAPLSAREPQTGRATVDPAAAHSGKNSTRFANGIAITVNFGATPFALPDGGTLDAMAYRVSGYE